FGEITDGASNDLQKATQVARHMIMDNGMSAKLPNRVFGSQHDAVFLGRELGEPRNYSEDVAKQIDDEVAALIAEAANRARETVASHREQVNKIAAKLIKDEVIDKDEFIELVGERPAKPAKNDPREDQTEPQDIGPDISGSPAAV
ncbi:MAG TPA: hypothetical protein VLF67_02600, partial [Candidatus Saccharimonas sp.]|nr:hypothetical protein [Candidatus Saccharimonas sp.]